MARITLGAGVTGSTSKGVRRELAARRSIRLLTTPPTVTLSAADAATAIPGSTIRAPKVLSGQAVDIAGDPAFSYFGTPSLSYLTATNAAYTATPNLTGTTSNAKYAPSICFQFYGDKFEIVFKALSSAWPYRLRIDGDWVTEEAAYPSGLTVGSVYRILVTFATTGNRQVQLDYAGNAFAGVACVPAHTVARTDSLADVPTVVFGDSITAGANPGSAAGATRLDTWVTYAAHLLGWRDVRNVAIAGTGFVTAGTEAAMTARLADLAVPGARFVSYFGLNDVAQVAGTLPGGIDTVFAAVAAQAPSEFIVLGCHPVNGNAYASSSYQSVNALLASKAAQYGARFIDTLGSIKWVSGTGNYSAPNGGGNADLFVHSDNTHPTRAGHQYLGRRYADAIAASYAKLTA